MVSAKTSRPTLSSCSTAAWARWRAAAITDSSRGTPSTSAVRSRPASITSSARSRGPRGGRSPAAAAHQQPLLPPLVLVLPRDRLPPPGGRLPVDDAGVVPRDPPAQSLEPPAFAPPPNVPAAR